MKKNLCRTVSSVALSMVAMSTMLTNYSLAQAMNEKPEEERAEGPEDVIVVTGVVGQLKLRSSADASSRLGLSIMDMPASVDLIDSKVMQARGYQKLSDAVGNQAGVVAGEHPSAPSMFSMRGFDRAQITVLRDGLWIGPASMTMRQQNTFNLERVEILRGPASVLNGNGAVAGTINSVNKTAKETDEHEINALASYGRWNSTHFGAGIGGPIDDTLFYRFDASRFSSNGYVDRGDTHSTNLTGSLLWKTTEDFSIKASFDYLDDEVSGYFGTPLVPFSVAQKPATDVLKTSTGETIDLATRFNNYNVEDAYAVADQLFVRLDMKWNVSDNIEINNSIYRYSADRNWQNAEGYVYCSEIVGVCDAESQGQVQRYYGYFILDHDQENYGNRLTMNVNKDIAGLESRSIFGLEYSDFDFVRTRGFRLSKPVDGLVAGDSVDLRNPVAGKYGTREVKGVSPTGIQMRAAFGENMLQITPELSLVTALRYEEMDLRRENFGATGLRDVGGFTRDFKWWSYRVGGVYKFDDNLMAYAQYSNAKDPVGSNIFLANASNDFDLTDAKQWELGVKAISFNGDLQATLSYYNITRDDILEAFNRDTVGLIGGRKSNGVEFSATMTPTNQLSFGVNAAYTNAEFTPSANVVRFAGNTPPNVPKWTAAAYINYNEIADLPVNVGASFRFVGERFADNANTTKMLSYSLVNIFMGWNVNENITLSARIDNLFNSTFLPWSDVSYYQNVSPGFLYANELALGAPRSYGFSVQGRF